jgi:hypothetical protein
MFCGELKSIAMPIKYQNEPNSFIKTMTRRIDEYESGKIDPLTLEELEIRVRKLYKQHLLSRTFPYVSKLPRK